MAFILLFSRLWILTMIWINVWTSTRWYTAHPICWSVFPLLSTIFKFCPQLNLFGLPKNHFSKKHEFTCTGLVCSLNVNENARNYNFWQWALRLIKSIIVNILTNRDKSNLNQQYIRNLKVGLIILVCRIFLVFKKN